MHELSVTENILSISLKHATQTQASRVTAIHLVVGQLSSVVDDSVQFYWDMLSENTLCQGAILHFSRIPATFRCLDCDKEFDLADRLSTCPNCNGIRTSILSGEEFYVESIEIERDIQENE